MIREASSVIQFEILGLFNRCLEEMNFPKHYKKAHIKVLLKSEDKNEADPKSYRPISLLLVIGNILERAIAGHLKDILNNHPRSSSRLYGFRSERSTEYAIVELQRGVSSAQGRYTMGLLFDVSSAFDNVWRPNILWNLKERNCSRYIYRFIQCYLERTAKIIAASE